ncbi:hypothetical protein [Halalkalibacter alkaliphilus]|uniref:Uncharacterized protein n=1 Tax=Halalkalibacter alkaliphilus TaxID=2917993 RepID=A0A9X2A6K6_9BACI|nr:hypothetical protein [Halalkalibacter alkaliphilus]MCL7746491.1 hypothetical protein [Halalkalibacter alkaliphilus]
MSMRPVEVQGSFPVSQKSGKIQEQLQQRGQMSQNVLTQQQKEEDLRKRKQVNESGSNEKTRLNKEGKNKQQHEKRQHQEDESCEEQRKHPFKGRFIDFSG